jgi:hypothetical protein
MPDAVDMIDAAIAAEDRGDQDEADRLFTAVNCTLFRLIAQAGIETLLAHGRGPLAVVTADAAPVLGDIRREDDARPPVVPLALLTDRTPAGPPCAPALRPPNRRAAKAVIT